jgi:hypothetical protein
MKSQAIAALLAMVGLVASSQAAEVVVTGGVSKGASSFGLDLSSSGDVASFNFRVFVPGADMAKVDLSKCASELPKSWKGSCAVAKGAIYVIANSEDGSALPAGLHSVGLIRVAQGLAKIGVREGLVVDELFIGDAQGNALVASVNSSID